MRRRTGVMVGEFERESGGDGRACVCGIVGAGGRKVRGMIERERSTKAEERRGAEKELRGNELEDRKRQRRMKKQTSDHKKRKGRQQGTRQGWGESSTNEAK